MNCGFWPISKKCEDFGEGLSTSEKSVEISTSESEIIALCMSSDNFNIMGIPYGTYDFDSVMHYHQCAFSRCGDRE